MEENQMNKINKKDYKKPELFQYGNLKKITKEGDASVGDKNWGPDS